MILDIHLEKCEDNGKRLERILNLSKPMIISLVPVLMLPEHESFKNGIYPSDYFYPRRFMEMLKRLAHNADVYFGQQGFAHYCKSCILQRDRRDPWHENMCLYRKSLSVEKQRKLMSEGKRVIEEVLGVSPILYVPPNHQFDENTLKVCEKLDFQYFVIRNKLNIKPYKYGKLIVLPENDLDEKGEVIYIHYDEMKDDFERYIDLIASSSTLDNIKLTRESSKRISKNYNEIILAKKKRDIDKLKI
ncbi:DUF2334 domain-containing protein [Candidatus Pacearchaeota archaeon]|nr:DUF2334 domain-containing protein [Candidatus Pacearchaeota archaeon]